MRTTDEPERFKPLGEKVTPQQPHEPAWKPYRDSEGNAVKGVEVDGDGKIRTQLPLPKLPRWFPV